jgi:hypothetical protein
VISLGNSRVELLKQNFQKKDNMLNQRKKSFHEDDEMVGDFFDKYAPHFWFSLWLTVMVLLFILLFWSL